MHDASCRPRTCFVLNFAKVRVSLTCGILGSGEGEMVPKTAVKSTKLPKKMPKNKTNTPENEDFEAKNH